MSADNVYKKKSIPVTGRRSPYGFETLRLPHFLDHRLIDGGEVVTLTRRLAAIYPLEGMR
jgi:hypothetical protein